MNDTSTSALIYSGTKKKYIPIKTGASVTQHGIKFCKGSFKAKEAASSSLLGRSMPLVYTTIVRPWFQHKALLQQDEELNTVTSMDLRDIALYHHPPWSMDDATDGDKMRKHVTIYKATYDIGYGYGEKYTVRN